MTRTDLDTRDDVPKDGGHALELTAAKGERDKLCRKYRRKRGAAAVEFAVVAPVFFLFIFGMIEYGRLVMVQQVITNASREGARQAVLDGATATDVNSVVTNFLASGNIQGETITITPSDPSSAAFGDPVSVQVSVPYSQISWLSSPAFLGGATMSATSVMRRERVN